MTRLAVVCEVLGIEVSRRDKLPEVTVQLGDHRRVWVVPPRIDARGADGEARNTAAVDVREVDQLPALALCESVGRVTVCVHENKPVDVGELKHLIPPGFKVCGLGKGRIGSVRPPHRELA